MLGCSFGALTPFCSCSSIPLFISFQKLGVPLGVVLHFNHFPIIEVLVILYWEIWLENYSPLRRFGTSYWSFPGAEHRKLNFNHFLEKDIIESGEIHGFNKQLQLGWKIYVGVNEANSIIKRMALNSHWRRH